MKNHILKSCAILVIMFSYNNSTAEVLSNTGFAVNASTLGVGLDLSKAVYKDYLTARVNVNYLPISANIDSVTGKINLNTYGMLLDYQPFGGNFRLSGGLYYNNNSATLSAASGQSITLNGTTYAPGQFSNYSGSINFAHLSPYLGFGYGAGAVTSESRKGLFFKSDIGIMYSKPTTTLNGTCAAGVSQSDCASFQQNLQAQINSQNNSGYLNLYPVINLGLGYRF